MELRYYGTNCIKITTKKATIVIDDTVSTGSTITTSKDVVLHTNRTLQYADGGTFVIQAPGEYEVNEVSVAGIATKLHFDDAVLSVLYAVHVSGYSIAVIGHTIADLTDEQLEKLGVVDVLIIPVGGNGYTLDSVEAIKLVKEIEPKIVIPTHFDDGSTVYEVPQAPVDEFVKAFGVNDVEQTEVLKIKDSLLPEKTQVVILKKQ